MIQEFYGLLNTPLAAAPLGFVLTCSAIFGCCLGSFLNVCIWRIPLGESIVVVPSHCPKCRHRIRWFDNVPVFAWLLLRGRCRDCGAPISPRYILVEAFTGLLYTGLVANAYFAMIPAAAVILFTIVLATAIPCAFIDVEFRRLPDRLTGFGMIAGVLFQWAFPSGGRITTHPQALVWSLGGMLAGLIGLGVFGWLTGKVFRRRTLGAGDIKYAGFVGAVFGWPGLLAILCAGSMLASLVYPWLRIFRRRRGDGTVPFGLYLGIAAGLWCFAWPWLKKYGLLPY